MRRLFPLFALLLAAGRQEPPREDALAPFPMGEIEASGPADASFLLEPPAGKRGFVEARDGHFFAGDRRIRFWGVNVCFGACFPAKEHAPRLAARLASLGVNCVRFHHMDSSPFPGGIFKDGKLDELSPEALERLDFFIAELAARGIYVNLNLHVSRWYSRSHKWPAAERLESYDKMVDIFHPELIEAQKKYARDLLGHKNPRLGRRYLEEPAVAMVEITNEDSLFQWGSLGALAELPDPYAGLLRGQWNAWLRKRHGSLPALRKAWSAGEQPLGRELLRDPAAWELEVHPGAKASFRKGEGTLLRVDVEAVSGTSWHIQFKQTKLRLERGRFYTVGFRARAERERQVAVSMGQDGSPWGNLGLSEGMRLGPEWKYCRFGFAARSDEENARLSLILGDDAAAVEISAPSLREGGCLGLQEGESPEKGTVALFPPGGAVTEARTDDRLRFLRDTERAFFTGMRRFLKEELGVRAPVTGTIAFGALGTQVQAEMDFMDQHAYWQHPRFPRRPWDPRDWVVPNRAMSADPDGGTFPGMALTRVLGKPYTVTEYNHPAPLDSQAETIPMIATFAARQDWDGVFLFAWSHGAGEGRDRITGFFDIDGNPAKTAFMGAGALVFTGSRLPAESSLETRPVSEEEAVRMARFDPTHLTGYFQKEGVTIEKLLANSWALSFGAAGRPSSGRADRGSVVWENGRYVVDAPSVKVVCGRTAGPFDLNDVRLELESPAAASILLVARDDNPIGRSKSMLLVACGRVENTGMGWNADRSGVADRWGTAPTRIEVVRGRVRLAGDTVMKVTVLDGQGRKAADVAVGDGNSFLLGAGPATLWYAVER